MKSHYTHAELEFKKDGKAEFDRILLIFRDLKSKQENGKELLERERNFFCMCLKLTDFQDEGKLSDFRICDDIHFQDIFLAYYALAFGGQIIKAFRRSTYIVGEDEQKKDRKFLKKIEEDWLSVLLKENHTEQLLQNLAAETRK